MVHFKEVIKSEVIVFAEHFFNHFIIHVYIELVEELAKLLII